MTEDVLFVTLYITVPVAALLLTRAAGVSLKHFSVPSFVVLMYLWLAWSGLLPLYFQWDEHEYALGVRNPSIVFDMLLNSGVALLAIVCGFVVARYVTGPPPSTASPNAPLLRTGRLQRFFFVGLFLACIVVLVLYLRQLEAIALVEALKGDILGAAVARSKMGNAFGGKYWRYQLFFHHILYYCIVFFFVDFTMRRRFSAALPWFAGLLVGLFTATMAIEKAPVLYLVVMLYLAHVMLRDGRYLQPVAKYAVPAVVGVLSLFYVYFMGAEDLGTALAELASRATTGQITPAYFYLERFPEHADYLLGASLPNPGGLLPFEPYPLTFVISDVLFPENYAAGLRGSAPTVFWAEMHANFGPAGVVVSAFLVGLVLFGIHQVITRLPRSAPVIAATTFLATHYVNLAATGLSSFLIDDVLAAVLGLTVVALLLEPTQLRSFARGRPRPAASPDAG